MTVSEHVSRFHSIVALIERLTYPHSMPLPSRAEAEADKARELTGFSNLSLPGVRQEVTTMLGLIGRDGIFSTYTRHDISHIDSMLQMLDWIIPDETKEAMTSLDWLLSVL